VGTEREPRVGTPPIFWLIIAAILAVIAVGMWQSAFYTTQEGPAVGETREFGGTVESIAASPERYIGQGVTVTGVIGEVLGPGAVMVESGGASLPVVRREAASPVAAGLQPNEPVQITGNVAIFRSEEMRNRMDAGLTEEHLQRFQDEPVILADSIARP
jgi:hypothetical protein